MRWYHFIFIYSCLLFSSLAQAELKDEEYYKEMDSFHKSCQLSINATYYDCECLTMRYMDLWEEQGKEKSRQKLLYEIRHECPNSAGIGLKMYEQCMSWAYKIRPDFDNFCTCYAREYVNQYKKSVSTDPLVVQKRMSEALNTCGYGEDMMKQYMRRKKFRDKQKAIKEQKRLQEEGMSINSPISRD